MSQDREPCCSPFKARDFIVFSIEKPPSDFLFRVIRYATLIILIASFSVVLYSAVTSSTPWFRFPYDAARHYADGLPATADHVSGDNIGETNISHIQFGVAGLVTTWNERRHYNELWWDRPNRFGEFSVGLPNVRWFVMGDDDTVFFTENLVSVLAKYDHRQMYYIGANSESVEQDVMHAYGMAYGLFFIMAIFDRC